MTKNPPYPLAIEVEAGQSYSWCSCRMSELHPLCDRNNCGEKATLFKAVISETVLLCGCGQTKSPPFCDGSHGPLYLEWLRKMKEQG